MSERRPSRPPRPDVASSRAREPLRCTNCGADLEVLVRPVRRLRWTRHWWRGVSSLLSQPLRHCKACGSLYDAAGALVATGATETETEAKVRRFRNDMIGLRDGFGAVVLGSGLTVAWTVLGPVTYDPMVTVLAGSLGVAALGPFGYFMTKVRKIKRQLKEWRKARKHGGPIQ